MLDTDTLLTTTEAAQRLGVTVSALTYWRTKHAGPRYVRVGGRVRYRIADLDAYVDANTINPEN